MPTGVYRRTWRRAPTRRRRCWVGTKPVPQPVPPPRFHVREKPPLALGVTVDTPAGKRFRWAHDEHMPDNAPSSLALSSAMPGGHDQFSCVLPRKASRDYCVDEATEILTERGWLNIDEVTMRDRALALDPATKEVRWEPILRLNVFPSPGELVHWKHSTFDALTSLGHRWLADGTGKIRGHGLGHPNWHFVTTGEIVGGPFRRLRVGGGVYEGPPESIEDDLVELGGWYVAEGWANGPTGVCVSQCARHNPLYVEHIRRLADRFSHCGRVGEWRRRGGSIITWRFGKGIGERVQALFPEKALSPELLLRLSHRQLSLLYDVLMAADGHVVKRSGTHIWSQKNEARVDGFQMLCALLGRRTHARWRDGRAEITAYKSPLVSTDKLEHRSVPYEGRIWCPTTPSGTWMARRGGVTYWTGNSDLEELSKVTVYGPGGQVAYLGRLQTSPRVSGDQLAITPGAVGYQAALDDDQSARMIYVDQDVTRFTDVSLNEQIRLGAGSVSSGDFSWNAGPGGLVCALPNQALGAQTVAQLYYTAPAGVKLATVQYVMGVVSTLFASYTHNFVASDTDTATGGETYGPNHDGALHALPLTTARRFFFVQCYSNGNAVTPAAGAQVHIDHIAVYADHGLTTHAIDSSTPDGLLASDVVAHAIGKWCPELSYSTGPDGTIQPSLFVIPHLIFPDLTTASQIVKDATRFELQDWAVWENTSGDPAFYMNPRGARGRNWIMRVGPSGLDETGPDIDRLANSVVVQFTDTGGQARTVGPVGSGCDVEDSSLSDPDPLNPVNQAGITRRGVVQMPGVSTPAGAIKVGQSYLAYQKEASTAGSAKAVGHVMEDTGVWWPAWMMRAGDTATFVDAASPVPRRITKASFTDDDKTCQIDLDSPPESEQALLERLQVGLVGIGQG